VAADRAKVILRPNRSIITLPNQVWPTLTDEQWLKVEVNLKNLVIEDYAKRNNINPNSLTQSEIRDIVLGMEVASPSIQNRHTGEIEKQLKEAEQIMGMTVKTVNKEGQEVVVSTRNPYEQTKFKSHTDWRVRAISASNLYLRTQNIIVNSQEVEEHGVTYVLPKNLLRKFITISDLRTQIAAYMFGVSPPDHPLIKEIRCIVLVPQVGSHQNVTLSNQPPVADSIKHLEPLGWIHTQPTGNPSFSVPNFEQSSQR
jgi:pre-mRNA-processing factor 8